MRAVEGCDLALKLTALRQFDTIRLIPSRFADREDSVLSPLAPLIDCDQIEVGRHGIVVAADGRRGLLLPQVAAEWGWTRDEFLAHACRKAGLPPDGWRHGAQVHVFEAEILRESDP